MRCAFVLFAVCSLYLRGAGIDWKVADEGSFRITIPPDWQKMESRGIDSHVGRYDGQNAILVFDEVFGLGLTANETSESIEKLKERRADSKRLRFGEEVWQIQGRFASFSLSHLEARLRVHWPFLNVAELHVSVISINEGRFCGLTDGRGVTTSGFARSVMGDRAL